MEGFLLKRIYITGILSALVVISLHVKAQDPHFSQFSNTPLQINPALTGIFDGNFRMSNTYRSQWSSLGNGYKTLHVSLDAPVGKDKTEDHYFGVGLLVYQDKAGTAGFKSTIIEGSLCYTTALDEGREHFFALGFQSGLNQNSIDLTKATWDSQWNGDFFDPTLSSGESIQLPTFSYLDFNAGALYYYLPDENNYFNVGASISHIGRPSVSFYTVTETPLRSKITVHSSGAFIIGNSYNAWIEPKVLVNIQGKQKEILAGGYFKNKVQLQSHYTNYMKEAFFYGGVFYRYQDAVVLSARVEYNTWGLGISYDVNTSTLSKLSASTNAFEISLSYVSFMKRGNKSKNFNSIPRYF